MHTFHNNKSSWHTWTPFIMYLAPGFGVPPTQSQCVYIFISLCRLWWVYCSSYWLCSPHIFLTLQSFVIITEHGSGFAKAIRTEISTTSQRPGVAVWIKCCVCIVRLSTYSPRGDIDPVDTTMQYVCPWFSKRDGSHLSKWGPVLRLWQKNKK